MEGHATLDTVVVEMSELCCTAANEITFIELLYDDAQ